MPRKVIKKIVPSPDLIKGNKKLSFMHKIMQDPNLFHINRKSAASAFAIGLFMCYIPMPFQMIPAAFLATIFKANLPLSISLVWISNPLTMPPMFYFAYQVGIWTTGWQEYEFSFHPTLEWLTSSISTIGAPFLLGCLICACFLSFVSYFGILLLWRWSVVRDWQKRSEKI